MVADSIVPVTTFTNNTYHDEVTHDYIKHKIKLKKRLITRNNTLNTTEFYERMKISNEEIKLYYNK